MSIDAVLSMLTSGSELVSQIRDSSEKAQASATRHYLDLVKADLRRIYFVPEGVVSIVRKLARGDEVDEEEFRGVILDFNDAEGQLNRVLMSGRFSEVFSDIRVDLRTARTLDAIRWGKVSIRRKIQNELNNLFNGQEGVTPETAKSLLDEVEKLNQLIEEVDERL